VGAAEIAINAVTPVEQVYDIVTYGGASSDGTDVTDEIALNPTHFRSRSTEQSLSTLVHEIESIRISGWRGRTGDRR